jgi:phytoene dehydrogenase-like protein
LYNEFKDKSYSSVLERHFRDSRIRAIFGILAGSSAVSPRDLSAFIAMMMTREFIFKGAYNIKGGDIQVLPDAIRKKIVSFGGEVLTGSEVEKIMVKDTKVCGVSLKDRAIESRYVVSASDAHSTFEDLLKSGASGEMKKRLKGLATTSSAVVFYFGLRPDLALRREGRKNFWYCPSYGSVERLPRLSKDVMDIKDKPVFFYLPDSAKGPVVIAIINVGYRDNAFWDRKTAVIRAHILKAMNRLFGASESDIVTEGRRTPHDLFLLTKNHNGAIRGWASTPRQSSSRVFPQRTHLKNMFCTGHWTTSEFGQGGISNSINAARRTYEMILREERP